MFFNKSKPKQEVYLMERNGWFLAGWFGFKREIKIGISNKPTRRVKEVDEGIPGRIVIIRRYKVKEAAKIESELHQKYKAHNFQPKGAKRGSGRTEFFKLSNSQLSEIQNHLESVEEKKYLMEYLLFIIAFAIFAWILMSS
jgi:Meiotically up-regulated gene 113